MQKMTKVALSALLLLSVGAATASADAKKGQVLYLKKLKKACDMNGGVMAAKHTMAEWKKLYESGKLGDEIKTICPNAKDKSLQDKYMEHYFDFFHEYANDSGNIPAC